MRRRKLLTRLGAAMGSGGLVGTAAGKSDESPAKIERGVRKNEPGNANETLVRPFGNGDSVTPVDTGSWIDHDFSLITGCDNPQCAKRALKTRLSMDVVIGGDPVENPEEWLDGPYELRDEEWGFDFNYVTPPKKPGRYKFYAALYVEGGLVGDTYGLYEVRSQNSQ